jgi:predicted nucleic acid-binding protein
MAPFLLDTNVLSEFDKRAPNPGVVAFVRSLPDDQLFISVVSLGELTKGIETLRDPEKKERFRAVFEKKRALFAERTISLDTEIMVEWGRLLGRQDRTLPVLDSLLAATCLARGLSLLTRNEKDFASIGGLRVINPWEAASAAPENA